MASPLSTVEHAPSQAKDIRITNVTPALLTVIVAPEDIRNGARGDTQRCAVARACERLIPNSVVFVHPGGQVEISTCNDGETIERTRYDGGKVLANWIERFDYGKPVHPERFVLLPGEGAA